ncbi:MAG: 30S ribosomal protein S2 [Coriobacteriales bacterium]|nr:30S ribosomal protein S2 [Coriobacteriales bacterium]
MATTVNIRSLLDAAVHFGHQTRRWNPKMKPYIFTDRNGIYIIDLKRTLIELDHAYSFVADLAAKGGTLLFVGTKKQAQEAVATCAERCGMPYVNNRWLGGMLTNFVTIRSRVTYMEDLEAMEADGRMASLPKKEQIGLRKELGKLRANLDGVRNMKTVPQAMFVVDTKREEIAIHEAHRLGIPVIGIIDTNADPDEVDFGIPANDDAIRSVSLLVGVIADAILAGSTAAVITEAELIDTPAELSAEAAVDAEETAVEEAAVDAGEVAAEKLAAPEDVLAAEETSALE